MNDWKEMLTDVDDDYLIGISNKGIVKRAYKDKQESAAEILSLEEEASVKVGEETVTVRFPLGESKCTCPSRSICRHVIQAILTLQEGAAGEGAQAEPLAGEGEYTQGEKSVPVEAPAGEGTVQTEAPAGEGTAQTEAPAGEGTVQTKAPAGEGTVQAETPAGEGTAQTGVPAEKENITQGAGRVRAEAAAEEKTTPGKGIVQTGQIRETGGFQQEQDSGPIQGEASARPETSLQKDTVLRAKELRRPAVSDKVCKEIDDYPVPVLRKILGTRQFQNFAGQVISDVRPQIQYTSVVTVRLPNMEAGTEIVVKLLSPLEYSSCTCHKKELCVHKAAAILWCKLESGALTGEELAGEAAEEMPCDMDEIKDAAGQMKRFLEELFSTGLSRTSPDVLDHMERLAVISHNAGLPKYEDYFRGLFDSYNRYFKRKAAFQTKDLMEQITRLYRRVKLLQQARDSAEVRQHAGEFRAEYLPVGRLELIGIAAEHFDSRTGYEGETVYFLEENTGKWYTYTNARPVFYEKGRKRKFSEKGQAPWGLGISMEDLVKVRIRLTGAKCDERRRLSASQDTRGEVTGERKLSLSDLEGWYYRDFGKLFAEQIGKRQKDWLVKDNAQEAAELVFVQPVSCKPADFSQARQQLSLPLCDGEGREVIVEVTYSKEESGTIRYLERISEKKLPCFIGKLYLKDGRLRMYPVAVQERFSEKEL